MKSKELYYLTIIGLCILLVTSNAYADVPKIKGINIDNNILNIMLTSPVNYKVSKIDPFNTTINLEGAELKEIPQNPLKSNIIQEVKAENSKGDNKGVTISLLFSTPAEIDVKFEGNNLYVTPFTNKEARQVSTTQRALASQTKEEITEPTSKKSESSFSMANEIIAVFVEKTDTGANLIIKGNGIMPTPKVYEVEGSLEVEFENMEINAYIPSTLIAPIKKVIHTKEKEILTIKIDIAKNTKTETFIDNNEVAIQLSVEGPSIEQIRDKDKPGYLSINFQDGDIVTIIRRIIEQSGYNVIIYPEVSGLLSMNIKSIHWRDALAQVKKLGDLQVFFDEERKIITVRKSQTHKLPKPTESDLITVDFQDADVAPILLLLSEVSGYNIIFHPDIKDTIKYKANLKLTKVSWQTALDKLINLFNLGVDIDEDVKLITITPLETETKIEEARQKVRDARKKRYESISDYYATVAKLSQQRLQKLYAEEKITKVIPLNYFRVNDAIKALKDANIINKEAKDAGISADVKTNTLIVRDVPIVVSDVEKIIQQIDKPTKQILIESRIVELQTNTGTDLGVQWGVSGWGATRDGGILSFGGSRDARSTQSGTDYATTPYAQAGIGQATQGSMGSNNMMPLIINMPAAVAQGAGGAFGIGYINKAASLMLDFRLSALETVGKGKIISQPKVMTLQNEEAIIRHGARIPITTPGSTQGTYTTTYIDANLKLTVTPLINFDEEILLKIDVSKDEPDYTRVDVLGNPAINSRAATTNVMLKDGETVVIGGILKQNESEKEDGIPGLSKIPILGHLFKREAKTRTSEELMIFITPKILKESPITKIRN